jgi:RNA 3'-terminal phosphate cyclase (ATP)
MTDRLVIDGSIGEGGGQILRSALCLAAVTGRAVMVENIRTGRRRPGLAAQHLAAIRAVAEICRAGLEGDSLESTKILFDSQGEVRGGRYFFDIGAMRVFRR